MKIKILLIVFFNFILSSCSTSNFTDSTNYAIIVDAGSSGSRVHLFSYVPTSTLSQNLQNLQNRQNPNIEEINFYGTNSNKSPIPLTNTSVQAPLATFEQPFNLALAYLNAHNINDRRVGVYVYSTAGMRLLNASTRDGINSAIELTLRQRHPEFAAINVNTISGQDEALYAWLDVNYLNGNIAPNTTNSTVTNGTIDVGGASTQIAYEVSAQTSPNYKITHLNLFGKTYHLYLNSILGGGQDQMRNQMILNFNTNLLTNACFITGSSSSVTNAAFNDAQCFNQYNTILRSSFTTSENPTNKSLIPASPATTKFVALSSVYFAYNFFGAAINSDVTVQSLKNSYQNFCYLNWAAFQTAFPAASPRFLPQQCGDSVYVYDLLTIGAYQLTDSAVITISTADWTPGAMLMIASGTLIN